MGLLGLRTGEALGSAWDMVNLDDRVLRVERNLRYRVLPDGCLAS